MPSGGKRDGAGRKAGDAWVSTKPVPARVVAKARVREILSGSDPLAVLCRIAADEAAEKNLRVTAASAACPYLFPRLSAAVTASIAPEGRTDPVALLDKLSNLIGRYAPTNRADVVAADMSSACDIEISTGYDDSLPQPTLQPTKSMVEPAL